MSDAPTALLIQVDPTVQGFQAPVGTIAYSFGVTPNKLFFKVGETPINWIEVSIGGGGACDFDSPTPAAPRRVRLVSTTNIALTGAQSIDATAVITGDRILVAGQTTASDNGIYVANTAGAWTRATDWNDGSQMGAGTVIRVTGGAQWIYSQWVLTNGGAIIIGVTSLLFKNNGLNFDYTPSISTTAAVMGLADLEIMNAGYPTQPVGSVRAFADLLYITSLSAGIWLGGAGYRNLTDTREWVSLRGAQGKMTGVPFDIDLGTAIPGSLALTPDLTNFKMYGFDGQPGGAWRCWGEAYTALKRGANLGDADATIQPFTDKASRYDLPVATLTANRTVTLGTTNVITNTKVSITRRDATNKTLAIVNGGAGAGTKYTFLASPTTVERVTFRFDGTNWAMVDFEYVEA